ncbi:MAG TPA: hypothetical protein H9773_09820 [Candidatus Fournierella merdavium]|uniref:hypothetical protein n=1 Tax=Candidatus Allofournierella merdavium TaxID=2838593 RepID=UPI001F8C541F|nr:hypothetical protein [Candidatus Fournierella merdavium]
MFAIYKRAVADVEPFEYLPGAEELTPGSAAKVASGVLAKCAAADKPAYIIAGAKREDGNYPVIRVLPTTIFEAQASGAVAAEKLGTTLQLNDTADGVTTTEGGPFTVTWADGGTLVRGYFEPAAASV